VLFRYNLRYARVKENVNQSYLSYKIEDWIAKGKIMYLLLFASISTINTLDTKSLVFAEE
jgi:hypothetical protein